MKYYILESGDCKYELKVFGKAAGCCPAGISQPDCVWPRLDKWQGLVNDVISGEQWADNFMDMTSTNYQAVAVVIL